MASPSGDPTPVEERIEHLINEAFNLSLFHKCKVYVLVEHSNKVHTFKSFDQRSWPPPDHRLEENHPRLERLGWHDLIRTRLSEEQRKALIQLSLYLSHLTDNWPRLGGSADMVTSENGASWSSGAGNG
ncbi:hypothetical protein BJX64DRAFT_291125 [Aspergillus heterothallicus]